MKLVAFDQNHLYFEMREVFQFTAV